MVIVLTCMVFACTSSTGAGGSGFAPPGTAQGGDGFAGSFGGSDALATHDAAATDDSAAGTSSSSSGGAGSSGTCTPNCVGLKCGDDGCGGSCGTCDPGHACVQGGVCKELAQQDKCKGFQCDVNAYCTVVNGQAKCECKLRYEGNGKSCKDKNECLVNNGGCDPNAFCTNKIGAAPACKCMDGFTGNGAKCIDIDECKNGTASCGANAACVNTKGSWECNCDAGFAKKGQGCVDVDECATATPPCDKNATCTNKPGAFDCACKPGFKGNGYTCSQDKDCSGACDSNASCKPVPGKASQCVCNVGFSGSGTSCYAVPSTVSLHAINISPFDPDDNKTWDGGVLPKADRLKFADMVKDAAKAYATGNYLALLPSVQNLASFLSTVTSPPDPYGTAVMHSQGKKLAEKTLSKVGNTLSPFWSGVSWSNVTVDASTKLTIDLYDADVAFDDPIGKASVSGKGLLAALKFGKVLPVDVSKQGKGAIAFVQVQVVPAYVCGNAKCDSGAGETGTNCPKDCGGGGALGGGHFCDSNCGKPNATKTCYCDAQCKQFGDCCDAAGTGKAKTCAGSKCQACL